MPRLNLTIMGEVKAAPLRARLPRRWRESQYKRHFYLRRGGYTGHWAFSRAAHARDLGLMCGCKPSVAPVAMRCFLDNTEALPAVAMSGFVPAQRA